MLVIFFPDLRHLCRARVGVFALSIDSIWQSVSHCVHIYPLFSAISSTFLMNFRSLMHSWLNFTAFLRWLAFIWWQRSLFWKWLTSGMIWATLMNRPMFRSIRFALAFPRSNISSISFFQAIALFVGRLINKRLVSKSQPKTIFVSSAFDSAFNFLRDSIVSRGIGSSSDSALAITAIARRTTLSQRWTLSVPGRSTPKAHYIIINSIHSCPA